MDSTTESHERDAVDAVISRLTKKFSGLPSEGIAAIVDSEYERLTDAPLRDYIPVLVEHEARQLLQSEERLQHHAAGKG